MKAPSMIIVEDAEDLARKGANIFLESALESVRTRGRFLAALSGGSTPRPMHRRFGCVPLVSTIPWDKTHLFWVDERMVPYDHPHSNFGLARRDFLACIPIPPSQVHPIPVLDDPEKAIVRYHNELVEISEGAGPVFDLIFLGMGTDGHTASLLPGDPSLAMTDRWLVTAKGGDPDLLRITLTSRILNRARHAVFLVSGLEKAPTLRAVIEDGDPRLPASHVRPQHGRLTWLLDRDAASLISEGVCHGA